MSMVNTDELEAALFTAQQRVLKIQTKLHGWALRDRDQRFRDVFNLVADPAFLLVAWDRVAGNTGARTAGVDGRTAVSVADGIGVDVFLADLRAALRDGTFRALPVRQRMIPKPSGGKRRLGIPTIADRVVQASVKLVLEPIFEADFLPCSYGFRPNRRAHDAVAEVRYLASRPRCYQWVLEGDIKACFDEIDHTALLGLVRRRVKDKRVIALVRAFLKAGLMDEARAFEETTAGTPQGGVLSPLLANIALSVLDEHIAAHPGGPRASKDQRHRRRRHGLPSVRLVRYADDWCLMVKGTRQDAAVLREQIAVVLATIGLRLSPDKTLITHIDEGLDFLGWHLQRHRKRGTSRYYVYTYPSRAAVRRVTRKVKSLSRQVGTSQPLAELLRRVNNAVRGWCGYFRHGVSSRVFSYLNHVVWSRVWNWMRRKHRHATWKDLRRRYCGGRWWPADDRVVLYDPAKVRTNWYRYRGTLIPSPWPQPAQGQAA
ncbi:RNA-directed DNA polymerase [Flexivirga oryzae]|uniref:RNA-directed DNA polymerase n=2 Tax=Flexivirga oryzae TaxID=1794944 RepID=A0A839NAP8_9MICO|nr:RNA-directed DNA polymerase [Flexivirga oryzae]MBB2893064.1 RNA-directed DNA polymerase [Flexivirga oryzae]